MMFYRIGDTVMRGEEQNREEGEMAQKKLGGGRNRGGGEVGRREKNKSKRLGRREKLAQKVGRREKMAQKVGRREIYPLFHPPPLSCNTCCYISLGGRVGPQPFRFRGLR